jgi:hypothetical protein
MTVQFFQRLPTELQIKIFEESLEPRSLRLFDKISHEKFLERYEDAAPPVVLQICQILRAYFLPRYPFIRNEKCTDLWPPHLRFNSCLDTIVIYSSLPQALMDLSHWSSCQTSPSIRHLAIPSSLWQTAILGGLYPDWKKAMVNFTCLESFTIVSDEMMPRIDDGDRLKQAIEQTLLSVHRENKEWSIPQVKIIRTGEVCHKNNEVSSRLDLVDFTRGDVKEAYLRRFTTPECSACDGYWAMKVFTNGFPTLQKLLQWKRSNPRRLYVPTPSMFSPWPNNLATQLPETSRFMFDDSTFVAPGAMAILSFASFAIVSSI